MPQDSTPPVMSVVLGAGASRDVWYPNARKALPSPLDFDFFDLLQRLAPGEKDKSDVFDVIAMVRMLPPRYWRSLELAFYTLHLKAGMSAHLNPSPNPGDPTASRVVELFVRCIQAVLRAAHGTHSCLNHRALVDRLHQSDAIISFNYDLVIERALGNVAADLEQPNTFGPWLYGTGVSPSDLDIPRVLKLHGSSNWKIGAAGDIEVKTTSWNDAFEEPGYIASSTIHERYPIILPFWDKPIEEAPWIDIWRAAFEHLSRTEELLVWGYSLPLTDLKARYLFDLAQPKGAILLRRLCVIDRSEETQQRWRELFPDAQYWAYRSFSEFRRDAPEWWLGRNGNTPNFPGRIT